MDRRVKRKHGNGLSRGGRVPTRTILVAVALGTLVGALMIFVYVGFVHHPGSGAVVGDDAQLTSSARRQARLSGLAGDQKRQPRFVGHDDDAILTDADVKAHGLESQRRLIQTRENGRIESGDHRLGDHSEESTTSEYTGRRAVAVYFECCQFNPALHPRPPYLNELKWLHASWEFVTGRLYTRYGHASGHELRDKYARRRRSFDWLHGWEQADEEEFGAHSVKQTTQIDLIIFTNAESVTHIPADWGCVRYPVPLIHPQEANCRIIIEGTGWAGDDAAAESPFLRRRENDKMSGHLHHYRYTRSIEFFMWPEARLLDEYDKVLKTDLDTFLTPRFATWIPKGFVVSSSSPSAAYGCMEYTTTRLRNISSTLGLYHRGISGIGLTWYGSGRMIRRVGALATVLSLYIHETQWSQPDDPHEWAKWHQGVASMYGSELAINHLVPDLHVVPAGLIDVSTSDFDNSVLDVAHMHTFQVGSFFSKEAFHRGQYDNVSVHGLNNQLPAVYALQMAQRGNGLRDRFEDMHFIPWTIPDLMPSMRDPDKEALKLKG